jgi:hypothetical protein
VIGIEIVIETPEQFANCEARLAELLDLDDASVIDLAEMEVLLERMAVYAWDNDVALPRAMKQWAVRQLRGTTDPLREARVCETLWLSAGDLEDTLLDADLERCQGCGWWFDSFDLVGDEDDDEAGYCDDCRAERKELA